MQVNLRKANALQSEIRKAINDIRAETAVTVSEFTTDVELALSKGEFDFKNALDRKEALNKALFQIRAAVGRANAESGINDVLADIQLLDAQIAIKNLVATATVRKEVSEINARIVKMKQAPSSERSMLYGERYSNIDTGVVTENDVATAKDAIKALKREKQALSDKLLQLNVNTLIQLTDPTKITLSVEGLI